MGYGKNSELPIQIGRNRHMKVTVRLTKRFYYQEVVLKFSDINNLLSADCQTFYYLCGSQAIRNEKELH